MSSIILTILGVLHVVTPGELALRNTSDQRGSWALNESNIWNDIANLTTSTIPLIPAQFSCADKQDGLYSDPTAHNRYYKCSGGLLELHTCKDHLHYSHESQSCGQSVCHAQENGLYANYSLDCHEYYRCENQRLAESFTCGPDNTFSAAERLCLPSGEVVCVEPHCDYNSSGYFVLPATRCQAYYSCEHGTAIHHLCPYNTVFDVDRQCVPWSERSCCTFNTTHLTHHGSPYNFNFNHCGHVKNMSEECRRHFVQDSCFYECSPNVGPWAVKVEMKTRNERFVHVPLCSSDCEAWFEACIDDYTCTDNWVRNFKWAGGTNQCHPGSECRSFQDTFETAENFCHKVWDESWEVTPDELACMRIWFDGSEGNPNDNVAKLRVAELVRMANSGVPVLPHQSLVLMLLLVAVVHLLRA